MTPLALGGLGAPELIIILIVVLLLFGGSRLAGLGKSSGRALREFKEETKGLRDKDGAVQDEAPGAQPRSAGAPVTPEPLAPTDPGYSQPPRSNQAGTGSTVDPGDVRRDV
jgi:sec-independent protein translocase protein TatA